MSVRQEVGAIHRGAGGAKGRGRGECALTRHVPGSELGTRGTAMRARQEIGVIIQGGSRMRESRRCGSVRGALSNERPYRDRCLDAGIERFGWRVFAAAT